MAALVFPDSPADGDTYDADNGVIYTYDATDDSWTGDIPLTLVAKPTVDDVSATPDFVSGTGSSDDPFIITPITVVLGGSIKSTQRIDVSGMPPGYLIFWQNFTTPASVAPKFNQPVGSIGGDGAWQGFLKYNDGAGMITATESTFIGLLRLGEVYFSWTVTQQA